MLTLTPPPAPVAPPEAEAPASRAAGAGHTCRLRRVDPKLAVMVAGAFNALLGLGFLLAGYIVIGVAANRGLLDQIDGLTSDLGHGQRIGAGRIVLVWTVVVVVWTAAMTLLAALAVLVLNQILDRVGGVELDPEPVADAEARPGLADRVRPVVRRGIGACERWLQGSLRSDRG